MNLIPAFIIPILIIGFLFLFIAENKELPNWMDNLSRNSSSIWTYGIITITLLAIIKYLISN
ncbi:hypothetical protein [Prochlorococcus marinus]|uniref:Uncharacterized protein n=1 Tax=Prochlorococcus marinus str. PAC1 TaxID=59924 RepID=A0A0A2C7U8_PROMR|nr:hypothetical protein [Prochlorococcus marinus]KGG22408.1 hypothetical protein EV03_0078 [Prochlorococcus marinus str. PAC1]